MIIIFVILDPDVMKHGIPNIMHFGEHGGYKILVMQMLGPTLQEMKDLTKQKKLTGKSILKIAIQLVTNLFIDKLSMIATQAF